MGTERGIERCDALAARLGRWLPPVALVVLTLGLVVVLAVAGATWGYDYQAYVGGAQRVLDGGPLYDANVDVAGGFAIYLYPPPFALAFVPFALLPEPVALWLWTALLVLAFVAGTAILPVSPTTRWLVVLLGGLMWPLLYSVKLGQVGPVLFLAFAIGWRWIDEPVRLGSSIAAAALIKVQPILLLGWAAATHRWRAVGVALVVMALAAGLATVLLGTGVWSDYLSLLARVSAPVTTPHNFTPGAVAFQAGLDEVAAHAIQWVSVIAAAGATVWSWFRAPAAIAYLVTIVASQLVSPLLWEHYAMLLLLPVAWLLERRQWWAAVIPLALAWPVVGITPAVAYPIAFWAMLVAPLFVVGRVHPDIRTVADATKVRHPAADMEAR